MVQSPAEFRWSSHRAYLGLECIPWLETDRVLSIFSDVRVEAIKRFEVFTNEEIQLDEQSSGEYSPDQLHELCTWTDRDDEKVRNGQDYLSMTELFRIVCENLNIEVSSVLGPSQKRDVTFARALISLIGRESPGLSNSETARSMGRDPSATSHAADRLVKRMSRDKTLNLRVALIRQAIERSGSI